MKKLILFGLLIGMGGLTAWSQTNPRQHTETNKDTVKTIKNKSKVPADTTKRVIIGRDGKPQRTYKKK